MNTKGRLLVIDERDIQGVKLASKKTASEIKYNDLRPLSTKAMQETDFAVLYLGGETIVMKNRWGADGVIISLSDYKLLQEIKKSQDHKTIEKLEKKSFKEIFKGLWSFK